MEFFHYHSSDLTFDLLLNNSHSLRWLERTTRDLILILREETYLHIIDHFPAVLHTFDRNVSGHRRQQYLIEDLQPAVFPFNRLQRHFGTSKPNTCRLKHCSWWNMCRFESRLAEPRLRSFWMKRDPVHLKLTCTSNDRDSKPIVTTYRETITCIRM